MAKNKNIEKANKNIKKIINGLSTSMDDMYRNTYMNSPQQKNDLEDLNARINASIDNIVNTNIENIGMPSVSRLYSRLSSNKDEQEISKELENAFSDGMISDDLYGLMMGNKYLTEMDNEIDTVCRYMPKLEEALQVQKDCVLSADHFSKDFLTFENPEIGGDEAVFYDRVKDIKKRYGLEKLVEEIYENTIKYGEQYIYRIPYSIAISKLLSVKSDLSHPAIKEAYSNNTTSGGRELFRLNLNKKEFNIISESGDITMHEASIPGHPKKYDIYNSEPPSFFNENETFNIDIEICRSGFIESAVESVAEAFKKKKSYGSLNSIYESMVLEADKNIFDTTLNGAPTNDGLITGDSPSKKIDIKVPGCVVKKIKREQIIPIYIEDICMGYYYFELRASDVSDAFMGFKSILGDPLTNMKGTANTTFNAIDNTKQDDTIKYVASQLSKFIDKQFVNNNQDLAKEIYMLLKYNDLFNAPSVDLIKVTFIPPEDMVHFFFRQDNNTHRGISDLDKALVPAKIYSSLYITSAIGTLTRGQDKRVYYVKQSIDTNIAQTLLNTISQIKQSNFGIRQFQSINNVLNITGRFNDYVIPTNASGDPPIQFEVMPGQNIEAPTELMEQLQEMAINSTGIPIEIIQARQSIDYAMQLTMSSSKVLRFCYKRQELLQNLLTQLISPIYNYEYSDNVIIKIKLPPPSFINIVNTNQLVDNTKTFVQSIVDVEMADTQDDHLKNIYSREMFKYYLGTHLDVSAHNNILKRATILARADSDETLSSSDEPSDY